MNRKKTTVANPRGMAKGTITPPPPYQPNSNNCNLLKLSDSCKKCSFFPFFLECPSRRLSLDPSLLYILQIKAAVTNIRDWSLITGRGGYQMGRSRVQNFLHPPPFKAKTLSAPPPFLGVNLHMPPPPTPRN